MCMKEMTMRTRVAIVVAAVMGALVTAPAQAQTQAQTSPRPAASLPTCQHHEAKSTDCHIHDRKTYIDMSAAVIEVSASSPFLSAYIPTAVST